MLAVCPKIAELFSEECRRLGLPSLRPVQVEEYGCVLCQRYHREGDALYRDHLFHQSKHGVRRVPDWSRWEKW